MHQERFADAFKTVAGEQVMYQQVCKSHVVRNTQALIENLTQAIQARQDHSLAALRIDPNKPGPICGC
jgi:hypothetical protein